MKNLLSICVISALFFLACEKHNNVPEIKVGFEAMLNIEQLPLLFPNGTQTVQPLAYDATGKNWDHHFLAAFTRYIDSISLPNDSMAYEYVIFDEYGPGCLYRQQMNAWFDRSGLAHAWLPLGSLEQPRADANIRYYFDDEKEPRIDMHMKDYFGTKVSPFTQPLAFIDTAFLFSNSYYPLPFQKRLKVTCRPNSPTFAKMDTKWYQYTSIAFPQDFKVKTWEGPSVDDEAVREMWNNTGMNPNNIEGCKQLTQELSIKNKETKTLLEIKKPGTLLGLTLTIVPYSIETFFDTRLKIFWDENTEAAIDMPLSYLFGGGGKDFSTKRELLFDKSLTSLFFGFSKENGSFYNYFPMPFWKSAKIVLENNSGKDISKIVCSAMFKPASLLNYPSSGTGYFHARRTTDADPDTVAFRNVAFKETGRGHVVGIMFYSDRYDMDGDEFTYIDDSKNPQIHGSGTEDDHNQGWAGRAYQKQLWGGIVNGYDGAYRVYMNDSYIFNKNILITYEHSLMKPHFVNGGSTDVIVYYYLSKNGPNLELTDEIDVGNHFSEAEHQYRAEGVTWVEIVRDAYDGYERNLEYATYTDDGKAFNGKSAFNVSIDPYNQGVKIRKRINRRDNGVQTAEVLVDGVKVEGKPWHIVSLPITSGIGELDGWLDSDFEIPASYTKGKDKINIEVKYLASPQKGEINEFYYWVYSYK